MIEEPGIRDEITPDIIDLGVAVLCRFVTTHAADGVGHELNEAFRTWYAENYHALSLGGSGDTDTLAAMLMAACAKSFRSFSDTPRASGNGLRSASEQ